MQVGPREDGQGLDWKAILPLHSPWKLIDLEAGQEAESGEAAPPASVLEQTRRLLGFHPPLMRKSSSSDRLSDATMRELEERRHMDIPDLSDPTIETQRRRFMGNGAHGAVYECGLGGFTLALKEVAVKPSDQKDLVRKVRELRLLRQLRHPNVTACLGYQHRYDGKLGRRVLDIYSEMAQEDLDSYLVRGAGLLGGQSVHSLLFYSKMMSNRRITAMI
jgi:hypothetical protein